MKLPKLLFCVAVFALVAGAQNPRSLCFFFDFSSMNAAEQLRAQAAAISFAEKSITPADRVSVMTFTSEVKVVQDFSSDHDALIAALNKIVPAGGATAGDGNGKLKAIQDVAMVLEATPGKKQLIYFSSGISKSGADDQAQLDAAINAAARAEMAIYPIDTTGVGQGRQ